jgi:hypothetical protein
MWLRIKIKEASVNLLLLVLTLAITYLLLEFLLFRVVLIHWPPGMTIYLPETADVLAQNSKSGVVPNDYVVLLGDSYAKGVGDWMLDVGDDRTLPYHSANIIHDGLRRDVVDFGRSNAGSAETLVRMPTHIIEGSRCLLFPDIGDPASIVVYFYEGNDIRDNLLFLDDVKAAYGGNDAAQVDRYLAEKYAVFSHWRCHLHLGDVIIRAMKLYYAKLRYGTTVGLPPPGSENSIVVAGEKTTAPYLEGPAASLTDQQIEAAAGVFDRSMIWLRHRFPGVPVTVVYIPGPLSVYRFATDKAFYYNRDRKSAFEYGQVPVAQIDKVSTQLCGLVRQASIQQGAGFIDAKAPLRALAQKEKVHGPRDWGHINRAGYTVVGNLVVDALKNPGAPANSPCAPPP